MVPHAGAQVSSQAVNDELDNLSDINSWGVSLSLT
jgi:hypothetical protein